MGERKRLKRSLGLRLASGDSDAAEDARGGLDGFRWKNEMALLNR